MHGFLILLLLLHASSARAAAPQGFFAEYHQLRDELVIAVRFKKAEDGSGTLEYLSNDRIQKNVVNKKISARVSDRLFDLLADSKTKQPRTWKSDSDCSRRVYWKVTFDGKTSLICVGESGKEALDRFHSAVQSLFTAAN